MEELGVDDPTSITGISKLLNYGGKKDPSSIERTITGNAPPSDSVDEFKRQLAALTSLGIDMNEPSVDDGDAEPEDDRKEDADVAPPASVSFARLTEEQKAQETLRRTFGQDLDNDSFSMEKEKDEDDKLRMLEEIDSLLTSLKDDGIDVSRVPIVTPQSSIVDVRNVHRILRLKNDRRRYQSFADEFIMAGAYGVEWLFDGKKTYLGYQPNMEGWSGTVHTKLRRMRYDTSAFVGDAMNNYDMGHGMRIMLELLPSAFLYGRTNTKKNSTITDSDVSAAAAKLRDHIDQ
jgi:hypothetical protein